MCNLRGSGIQLVSSVESAIISGERMQSRLVQKYIERPLVLDASSGLTLLQGKKFDIRQWVLVTSFNPVTIYMFNSCYLRVCSGTYDINAIAERRAHLTNYSINKEAFSKQECIDESVCHINRLKEFLKEKKSIDYDLQIKSKMKEIVINTITSVKDVVTHHKSCFELYGFDILLDKEFNPWLLEVNMAPACSERTSWLRQMAEEMADGLFSIILGPVYTASPVVQEPQSVEASASSTYSWELIYSGEEAIQGTWQLPYANLKVVGVPISRRSETLLDTVMIHFTYGTIGILLSFP